MKRMTQLEVDARKALGPYGSQSTASIPWCIDNIVKGLADERHSKEAYLHDLRRLEALVMELHTGFEALNLGDDPGDTGTRMVNNEAYNRLQLTFQRVVESF